MLWMVEQSFLVSSQNCCLTYVRENETSLTSGSDKTGFPSGLLYCRRRLDCELQPHHGFTLNVALSVFSPLCACVCSPSLALMMMSGWKTLQEEESGVTLRKRNA